MHFEKNIQTMGHIDPRVDAYIARSAAFAIPILEHLRALVHHACPDVKETIKWSFPNFEYKGSILCSMSSFKQHCAFGFWLGNELTDPHNLLATGEGKPAMGNLGRITSVENLPDEEVLIAFIKEAMDLTERGVKSRPGIVRESKPVVVPDYFVTALGENPEACKVFEKASPSFRKEYVDWLEEAKTAATREKRMETALEWIAEGKGRNWKYTKK